MPTTVDASDNQKATRPEAVIGTFADTSATPLDSARTDPALLPPLALRAPPERITGSLVRVALVHPSGHLFNTPCVPSLVGTLARAPFEPVVYGMTNSAAPDGTFAADVVVRHFPFRENRAEERVWLILLLFTSWLAFRLLRDRPHFVIACGVRGLFVVGILSYFLRITFAYNSLEIYPSSRFKGFFGRLFKTLERRFNQRAAFSITQDTSRAELLRRENLLGDQAVLTFPNAPLPTQVKPVSEHAEQQLRARLNIPPKTRLLLYAGSLYGSWGGVERFVDVASGLPEGWLLVLQSRMSERSVVSQRSHDLLRTGRVLLSGNPLSADDYASLVATSSIGLAWYESPDENIRLVGLSSGKIAQYWAYGKPVIVNRIPLYEDVMPRYEAGIVVDNVDEIAHAVGAIWSSYKTFSEGASSAYASLFDVEESGRGIADMLRSIARATTRS